ncbi:MAG: TIGR02450 family Trp-rich protein [Proteobacteria bacterium]|nr:TIGR02450 family Trp-rich protein [Pseudomonadota bacterium]
MPRVQRRFLLRSRWTARTRLEGTDGECHFEVAAVERDQVTLRAVLTGRDYPLAIAALDDAAAWALGWQSIPPREP